jgi:hypothetical protein
MTSSGRTMHLLRRLIRRSHPACLPCHLHVRPRLGPRDFQFKGFFRFCNFNFGLLPNPREMPATFRRSADAPARIGGTSPSPPSGPTLRVGSSTQGLSQNLEGKRGSGQSALESGTAAEWMNVCGAAKGVFR